MFSTTFEPAAYAFWSFDCVNDGSSASVANVRDCDDESVSPAFDSVASE
jgi:hypothetical protein